MVLLLKYIESKRNTKMVFLLKYTDSRSNTNLQDTQTVHSLKLTQTHPNSPKLTQANANSLIRT